ncbi:unnamed protein product [Polarella glacialis]|uniref:Uncharacterized protein n=1 Tax=Polarella glacialis TaxID=89957 RepID=A0A813LQU2_POLGL|nr:unnamed protein product [Polarella glacialis]CAE8735814.1 unnamed protein product [Polarella glacialis]|mmetsp:Transcript_80728/g.145706  ORF Transcript_80728/g.145706 Transcript_80728/m.145706 type:complete len:199 (-) Transcript_80728:144-740(-)|eukprot:CAMPEP_0115082464 /NCGR_PEP_ID=MMETSP0227-20121206/19922_1 /TAXON_ID=89957 /ORGANISM="Polarella glacialis, Strain CCMP 1383" /LENGTH=198 /DNA_ID=CAMNT_0002470569 /DNA_START=42 /DNA_END=638 /DNA_ORIENTATION=-
MPPPRPSCRLGRLRAIALLTTAPLVWLVLAGCAGRTRDAQSSVSSLTSKGCFVAASQPSRLQSLHAGTRRLPGRSAGLKAAPTDDEFDFGGRAQPSAEKKASPAILESAMLGKGDDDDEDDAAEDDRKKESSSVSGGDLAATASVALLLVAFLAFLAFQVFDQSQVNTAAGKNAPKIEKVKAVFDTYYDDYSPPTIVK